MRKMFLLASFLFALFGCFVRTAQEDELRLVYAGYSDANPDKEKGEDAFFMNERALGVADGVGGWALQGIDASLFAKSLVSGASEAMTKHSLLSPLALMWSGLQVARRSEAPGSSTFCIASLVTKAQSDRERSQLNHLVRSVTGVTEPGEEEGKERGDGASVSIALERVAEASESTLLIAIANLGDSGALIIRQNEIFSRTKEQQHDFNFPFQLAADNGGGGDLPSDASLLFEVAEPGDLLLLASDGLYDNVVDGEILDEYARLKSPRTTEGLSAFAKNLVALARERGANTTFDSPFARHAREAGWGEMIGGKQDVFLIKY